MTYDTRRFVAGWGGSNMGWDGTLVSIPGSAVIEDRTQLPILGVEAEGAKARLAHFGSRSRLQTQIRT